MIPNMHLVKAVLIVMLISVGMFLAEAPHKEAKEEKTSDVAIELVPSVFDSLGQ